MPLMRKSRIEFSFCVLVLPRKKKKMRSPLNCSHGYCPLSLLYSLRAAYTILATLLFPLCLSRDSLPLTSSFCFSVCDCCLVKCTTPLRIVYRCIRSFFFPFHQALCYIFRSNFFFSKLYVLINFFFF